MGEIKLMLYASRVSTAGPLLALLVSRLSALHTRNKRGRCESCGTRWPCDTIGVIEGVMTDADAPKDMPEPG
jgi:hypothetical protein